MTPHTFTINRLFLWMLYFASYAAIFATLPSTSLPFGVATLAATFFVVADIRINRHFRGLLGISYFACALAYVVVISLVMILLYPPAMPPKSPLPFWSGLYHLVSGGLVRDIAQEIGAAILLISLYMMTVMAFTLLSTAIAVAAVRQRRESKWLLLMNLPGIVLFTYIVSAVVYAELFASYDIRRPTPEPCYALESSWPTGERPYQWGMDGISRLMSWTTDQVDLTKCAQLAMRCAKSGVAPIQTLFTSTT